MTAGLAALRAAAQRHGIGQEHERDAASEHAQEHEREAGSIRERLARIVDRGIGHKETGPGLGQDDIRARLGRILGREARQDHAEQEPGASAPEQDTRSLRERHRHKDREDEHEL